MEKITADTLGTFLFNRTNFEARKLSPDNREGFSLRLISSLLGQTGQLDQLPPVLHVAGTNGKGSVCFFLEQGLASRGLTTGTFLSPHVERINERIRLNGRPVEDAALFRAADRLRSRNLPDLHSATTFEILFLLAIEIFINKKVEYCIFETGLGGRLDTTNILSPKAVLISPISLDHTAILGTTLKEIALEKAGIIKPGVPCFLSAQQPVAAQILLNRCQSLNSDSVRADTLPFSVASKGIHGFEYSSEYGEFHCRMPGSHQAANLHLALCALHYLKLKPNISRLSTLLASENLPARMEYLPGTPAYLLDGGHNPAAAEVLVELLQGYPDKKVFLAAIQEDKDYTSYLRTLHRLEGYFIFTTTGVSRSAAPELLRTAFQRAGEAIQDSAAALQKARETAGTRGIVVICGSFYLCGSLRQSVRNWQ